MKNAKNRLALLAAALICMVAAQAQGQLQQSFFSMGVSSTNDMPPISYGTLSHPPVAWSAIEGTGRGIYNFSEIDSFVTKAPKNANNVAQIDVVMGWTPGWAVSSQANCMVQTDNLVGCTVPPDNMADWTDFITALVQHYNGVNAPHVQYYEIWNEANNASFWTAPVSQLVAMAKAAYPILKQDPYSQVLTPSVIWTNGTSFMTSFLSGGGNKYADGVSFHSYTAKTGNKVPRPVPLPESSDSTNAPIQTMLAGFRSVANANGMQGKPLATTEGGWGVNGVSDPDMQAAWITQYYIVQAGLAVVDKVAFTTWYAWGHAASGTIQTPQGPPSEAGYAYQEVNGWLAGQMTNPCRTSGNIWTCLVGKNLIVWDISQTCSNGVCTSAPYDAPKGYVQYVDLTGTTHPIDGAIALGVKPIMMER